MTIFDKYSGTAKEQSNDEYDISLVENYIDNVAKNVKVSPELELNAPSPYVIDYLDKNEVPYTFSKAKSYITITKAEISEKIISVREPNVVSNLKVYALEYNEDESQYSATVDSLFMFDTILPTQNDQVMLHKIVNSKDYNESFKTIDSINKLLEFHEVRANGGYTVLRLREYNLHVSPSTLKEVLE